MAMDAVFDFDNQEYVSEVVDFRKFFDDAMRSRRYWSGFGIKVGDEAYWKNDFISSVQHPHTISEADLRTSKRLVDTLIEDLRHPTKQYNFGKDDGRGRMALSKKPRLSCMNSLLMENEKKRNPQYKSIVLRSMRYDRFDTSVISHSVRHKKLQAVADLKSDEESNNSRSSNSGANIMEQDGMIKKEVDEPESRAIGTDVDKELVPPTGVQSASTAKTLPFYNPYEDQCPVPVIDASSFPTDSVSRVFKNKFMLDMEPLLNLLRPEPHFGDEYFAPQMAATPSSYFCDERFTTTTNYFQPIVGAAPFIQTESFPPIPPTPVISPYPTHSVCSQMSMVVERQSEVMQCYPVQPHCLVLKQKAVNEYNYRRPTPSAPSETVDPNVPIVNTEGSENGFTTADQYAPALVSDSVVANQEVLNDYNCHQPPASFPLQTGQPSRSRVKKECDEDDSLNDIVAQVSVHVGYPRPLEKQEVRLGRLLKVLDRFLILGSNTLKDLKDAIDCPADYLVFADVSERPVKDEDLCKNRYPSSFFFFHDTFYVDLEPEGAQDITSEVRAWANERCLGETKVAYMNESKIVDLKCRLGAPYLYVHVGSCEHLISFNNLALRDKCHPTGPYPVPIFERNSRRIVCAGCKELTAEWVVWDHESTPSPVQYFCDPCYKDFNYDTKGRKTFHFKAAPLYDRHSRRTDITERTNSREDMGDVDEQND